MWPEGHWDPERLEGNRAGVLPLSDSATRRPLGGHAHTLQEDPPTSKNIPSIFLPGVDPSGPFQGEHSPGAWSCSTSWTPGCGQVTPWPRGPWWCLGACLLGLSGTIPLPQ